MQEKIPLANRFIRRHLLSSFIELIDSELIWNFNVK